MPELSSEQSAGPLRPGLGSQLIDKVAVPVRLAELDGRSQCNSQPTVLMLFNRPKRV
jgi:hypothetical protein